MAHYAVLRVKKHKAAASIRRSFVHAFRDAETPNADRARTSENTHIGPQSVEAALAAFNTRLPAKVRSNGVRAIEYLVTASPEAMAGKDRNAQDAYFADAVQWLQARHGAENVVYAGIHRDETTPHLYAYVVPIDPRGKLNCRHFLGQADALSQMQTDFAQHVGQPNGLLRGLQGSKAKHERVQAYYARIVAPVPSQPSVEHVEALSGKAQEFERAKRGEIAARRLADQHQQKTQRTQWKFDQLVEVVKRGGKMLDAIRTRFLQGDRAAPEKPRSQSEPDAER